MALRDPRAERRKAYDDHTRITLLEDDADQAEATQARIESKLDGIRTMLVTGAVTFAASAILLGINIAITLSKGG